MFSKNSCKRKNSYFIDFAKYTLFNRINKYM